VKKTQSANKGIGRRRQQTEALVRQSKGTGGGCTISVDNLQEVFIRVRDREREKDLRKTFAEKERVSTNGKSDNSERSDETKKEGRKRKEETKHRSLFEKKKKGTLSCSKKQDVLKRKDAR